MDAGDRDVIKELIDSIPSYQKLFRLSSISKMLNISKQTLRQCIYQGLLTSVRATSDKHNTRSHLITRAELIRFIKENFEVSYK